MTMNAVRKSMERSRGVVNLAHSQAIALKQSGLLGEQMTPMAGGFGLLADQTKERRSYRQFRGWLYSAIHALASEAAGQPVVVGRLGGKERPKSSKSHLLSRMTDVARGKAAGEELEIVANHELVDVLERPNSIQNRWQFVYSFVANLNLTGWSYVVRDETKSGVALYSLPSTWVRPDHEKGAFSRFWIVNPSKPSSMQGKKPLDRSQVTFAYLPDPSNPFGSMTPSTSQQSAIRIDRHIQTSQEVFFENGIFPGVIVTMGKRPYMDSEYRPMMTGAQRRQITGAISKVMGGVSNYGNPAIVDGMIEKIERFTMGQNEMGWDKSENKVRTRILSAFGVHPFILGEPLGVGGYAQAAIIETRFFKKVNTFLDMLGTVVTSLVSGPDSEEELLVWWEKCVAEDPSLRSTNLRAARNNDDITQNEWRAEHGFPPDEDGNQAVVNRSSLTPIVQLLAQVSAGAVSNEQAVAVLVGLGIPEKLAKQIAGPKKKPEGPEPMEEAVEGLKRAVEMLNANPIDPGRRMLLVDETT